MQTKMRLGVLGGKLIGFYHQEVNSISSADMYDSKRKALRYATTPDHVAPDSLAPAIGVLLSYKLTKPGINDSMTEYKTLTTA